MLIIRRLLIVIAVIAIGAASFAQETTTPPPEKRILVEGATAAKLQVVKVTVEPQYIGKTEGDNVQFGGGTAQTMEVKPKSGAFVIVDVKVKAADGNNIGFLKPAIIDKTGKKYQPRFMGTFGERSFSGGMIIDGKLQEDVVGQFVVYKPETTMSFCFDLPKGLQNLKFSVSPESDTVAVSVKGE